VRWHRLTAAALVSPGVGGHPNGTSVTHATPGGIPAGGGWLGWAVGTRVVVRRRLPEGGYGDVLGDLLEVGPEGVVVQTRRGPVRVAAADIALGKPVPPAPPRRAPRAGASPEPATAPDPATDPHHPGQGRGPTADRG
jgi:hypothetical protein